MKSGVTSFLEKNEFTQCVISVHLTNLEIENYIKLHVDCIFYNIRYKRYSYVYSTDIKIRSVFLETVENGHASK